MLSAKQKFWIVAAVIVLIFLALRIPFLDREYGPEEPLWVSASEGVTQFGFPIASLGITRSFFLGYWKPPFLPLLLGAAYKLFGSGEVVSRGLMLFLSFLELPLIFFLCRRIFGHSRGKIITLVAVGFIAINPFAIQNATYLEADATILTVMLLILLYLAWPFIANEKYPRRLAPWLGILGTLALFARIETTIMVFFALVLIALFTRGWRRALVLSEIFIAAAALFFALYWLYAMAFGYPEIVTKSVTEIISGVLIKIRGGAAAINPALDASRVVGFQTGRFSGIINKIFPLAASVVSVAIWYTLPFILIACAELSAGLRYLFGRLKNSVGRSEKILPLAFLILPTLVILGVYGVTGTGVNWPRHTYLAFILIIIALAAALTEKFSQNLISTRSPAFLIISAVLFLIFSFTPASAFLFPERVHSSPLAAGAAVFLILAIGLFLGWRVQNIKHREKFIKSPLNTPRVSAGIKAVMDLIKPRRWRGEPPDLPAGRQVPLAFSPQRFIFILIALYLAGSLSLVMHDLKAPYTLTAYYGNFGYKAAGEYLHAAVKPGETVMAIDTIGYYYRRPYYEPMDLEQKTISRTDWVAIYTIPAGRFERFTAGKKLIATFDTVQIYRE